jgi:alanyl-tRNA synthetase
MMVVRIRAMRLYYTDPSLLTFTSQVRSVEPSGDRWHVRLEDSAFYPTTGGQPFDTGQLGAARVVDVLEDEQGEVVHVVDRPLAVAERVEGTIDAARRHDHMQQHTGQHVLSAAFVRTAKVPTISFHLGSEVSTIDLAREVSAAEIAAAEDAANEVVRQDRLVSIRFASAEEAAALPLRKEPRRAGELRLIDIADWDLSACGGTHVGRTGEIGLIAVGGWERFKGGSRVEFVCGRRALVAFRRLREVVAASTRLLSVLPAELPTSVARLQDESKDLRRQQRALLAELFTHRAGEYIAKAEERDGLSTIVEAVPGADAGALKTLASTLVAGPGRAVVLFADSRPALVVAARSADVQGVDAGRVLKALVARFGGKGGGRPDLAQGGGLDASPSDLVAAARDLLSTPVRDQV